MLADRLTAALSDRYRIERELGQGGMAIVYLAHDLRHDRPVALKLLRPELAAIVGGERFLAEIRTTANLQHPHILPLHDSGEADGLVYYVMPYVQGESLRDRLRSEKQLPVDDAVRVAREVASALDYAHRHGVVHRDIKPENILLHDGQALVADFGIALAASRSEGGTRMTETGMSLGTPQYMAPEQAMGEHEVGPKADVYALGCVLYEMLVGEPPFVGPTPQAIIARLVTEQPRALTIQRRTVPPHVEAATFRALQKLPADRFATAAQFAEALATPSFGAAVATDATATAPRSRPGRRAVPVTAAAVLAAAVTSAIWWSMRPARSPLPVTRFTFAFPEGQIVINSTRPLLALSPDGKTMVYAANNNQLLRRSMSELDVRPIPGADVSQGISNPAFSPDGESIAFWSGTDQAIKRVPATGGAAFTICDASNPVGMSWDSSGIVFAATAQDIMRVSADGGKPEVLVDLKEGEAAQSPQMLPGSQAVLFTLAAELTPDRWERAQIVVQQLRSGKRKVVVPLGSDGRYVPTGHIVYAVGGSLFAVRFDAKKLEVSGAPVPVVEGVRRAVVGSTGTAHFTFSASGTLIYLPGPTSQATSQFDVALTDRNGNVMLTKLPPGPYGFPRVSPDGKRIAVGTNYGKESIIWIYDLAGTSAIRRLTLGGRDRFPIWSADGQWVAFQSEREGDAGIFRQRADGSGAAERLTKAEQGESHIPESWSPKNDGFLYSVMKGPDMTLMIYSLARKSGVPFGGIQSKGNNIAAAFSPDGRWVAYASSENGTDNYIYIQPVPPTGARYQISKAGENGHDPLWTPNGKELLYVPFVGQFVARTITTQPTLSFGNPVPVPRSFPVAAPTTPRTFDITPDGKVVGVVAQGTLQPSGSGGTRTVALSITPQVEVVLNWFEDLKQRTRTSK